ncbi:hypothetical protein GCM10023238_29470 [Streptomyces heliomycini]
MVAGITLASSASVAHDLYASLRRRRGKPRSEVAVARSPRSASVLLAIGSSAGRDLNVAFPGGLAFAVAASANLPVLLYSLFWRGFTTRGAVWAVYGGLIPAVCCAAVPVGVGQPRVPLPGRRLPALPACRTPVWSPSPWASSRAGSARSLTEVPDEARHAETEVRSLTGAGAV